MTLRTLPRTLHRRLQVAIGSNRLGSALYAIVIAMANYQPATKWFWLALKSDFTAASVGVWSWPSGGPFGRVHIQEDKTLTEAHAHIQVAHASGTMDLELWRNRGQTFGPGSVPGVMTRLATVSVGGSENDGGTILFTFLSEALKELQADDCLHLQPVGVKPGGSGWIVYVDVHFAETAT